MQRCGPSSSARLNSHLSTMLAIRYTLGTFIWHPRCMLLILRHGVAFQSLTILSRRKRPAVLIQVIASWNVKYKIVDLLKFDVLMYVNGELDTRLERSRTRLIYIHGQVKEDDFKRLNTNNELVPFYMNEMGAENAALWAVQQSYPFSSIYNACDSLHSWHFHLTPKTHHEQKTAWAHLSDNVPPPYAGYQDKESRKPHPKRWLSNDWFCRVIFIKSFVTICNTTNTLRLILLVIDRWEDDTGEGKP
jgi:hypothetical protein